MNVDEKAKALMTYLSDCEGISELPDQTESNLSSHQLLLEARRSILSQLSRYPRYLKELDVELFSYFEEYYSKGSLSILLSLLAVKDFCKLKISKELGADFTQKNYYLLRMATHSQDLESVKFVDRECGHFFSRFGIDMDKVLDVSRLKVAKGMLSCSNFSELCEFITGRKTAFIQKKIHHYIFRDGESSPNTEVLDFLKIANKSVASMQDPSKLVNLPSPSSSYLALEDYRPKLVKTLGDLYSETVLLRFLVDESDSLIIEHTIRDLSRLFQRINTSSSDDPSQEYKDANALKKALGRKPKTIQEVHDNLSRLLNKIGQPLYDLKRSFVAPLDGRKVGDYLLVTPKTSHELVELGSSLGEICVGNGHYAESDIEDKTNIVAVFQEGKAVACIEVNKNGKILESKSFYNSLWKDEEVHKFITENVKCQS